MKNNFLIFLFIVAAAIFCSCSKEKPVVKKVYNEAEDLKAGAPASVFTVKIQGTGGAVIEGYVTPVGKEPLDSIVVDGTAGSEVKTMKANRLFCYVVKKGTAGSVMVSVFAGEKLMVRDSTSADGGFIQLTAMPDSAGIKREYVRDSVAFYLSITCEDNMNVPVKIRKSNYQNFATSMHKFMLPALIPITDCKKFEADVFNDENFMAEFTCEIWNSKKEPIAHKTCPEGGPGTAIHLYDDEYFKKKKIIYDTVEAKK
jgi:hypothetical protein